jgi:hypothetical protein
MSAIGSVVNLGIVAITRAGDFAVDVEFDNVPLGSIITPQIVGAYLPVTLPAENVSDWLQCCDSFRGYVCRATARITFWI